MMSVSKRAAHYTVILRPEPEGGFTVTVPALPGCVTYGRTLKQAQAMAHDAIAAYVASLRKHREPIPTDFGSLVTSVDLQLPTRYGTTSS